MWLSIVRALCRTEHREHVALNPHHIEQSRLQRDMGAYSSKAAGSTASAQAIHAAAAAGGACAAGGALPSTPRCRPAVGAQLLQCHCSIKCICISSSNCKP